MDILQMLAREATVLGVSMSNQTEFRAALAFAEEAKLEPVVDKSFPYSQFTEAMHYLKSGAQFGKVVISLEG